MSLVTPFHKALRQRREELGISSDRAAEMLCLSDMEYYDLEAHETEWLDCVPAYTIRFAISIFGIDWRNVQDWPEGGAIEPTLPLDECLRSIREQLGITREAFADRAGYSEPFARVIESHPDGLALWPLATLIDVGKAFDIQVLGLAECVLEPRGVWERIAAARQRQ